MVAPVQPILISNGEEFFEISPSDLDSARGEGFYVPAEHGLALVTDGDEILEIPLDDVADAEAEGFRRLDSSDAAVLPTVERSPLGGGLSITAARIVTGNEVESVSAGAVQLQISEPETERIDASEVALETEGSEVVSDFVAPAGVDVEEYEDEDDLHRAELLERLEEAEGFERWKLILLLHAPTPDEVNAFSRTYGLSTLLHIVGLLILSLIFLASPEKKDGGAILSSVVDADEITEDEETPEIEIEEITEVTENVSESTDAVGEIQDTVGLAMSNLPSLKPADFGGGTEGVGEAAGDAIKAPVSFFGAKTVASRFVFVIDNSNSMTKGRFETALNELAKTLEALTEEQYYYIMFYSDTAYGLYHPYAVADLVPATKKNKIATLKWLLTVQLCLRTDAALAMKRALDLDPDVIFVLGDGAFTDASAVQRVIAARTEEQKKIKINALGMEVNASAAKNFTFLAQSSGGTYNDVGVHPAGAEIARRAPRPKNNKRGPVWGINLPK